MSFDWLSLTRLLVMLNRLALEWYRMVSSEDENGARVARKAASRVLDPETEEDDADAGIRWVNDNGVRG